MKFKYKAKTKEGKATNGVVEAKNSTEALSSLRQADIYVMDISAASEKTGFSLPFGKKVGLKDKIIFTKELAMMIKSGLPITEALEALAEETHNKHFSEVISDMISSVKGGTSFSKSLAQHPDVFSEIYVQMVGSGEESGKIDLVLNRLAVQLEKDFELNRKVRGALAYPTFVMFALVAVMILVMTVIIPQLKLIFDDAGVALPLLTRIVIGISFFIKNNWFILLIAVLAIAAGLFFGMRTATGKQVKDRVMLKIPVLGGLFAKTCLSRFTRTFASLAASGLPLIDVFTISAKTVGNSIYEKEIIAISEKIKNGQQISSALKESSLMPRMVGQLAIVGEKSGNIEEVFDQISDFFDRDIDTATANLSTLLEPVLMVVMGVGIGLVIISVLQPIYGLVNAI